MPTWIENLLPMYVLYMAASALLWAIRLNLELKSSLVLDWGPQSNRFREWGLAAWVASWIWIPWTDSPDFGQVLWWLCMGLFAIYCVLTTIPRQGIYEGGVFLMQKTLWMASGRFIRWSEIQNYRWDEQGRLVINSGWHSMTCKVTPEMMDALETALKEKCPEAELKVPQVKGKPEASEPGAHALKHSTPR